MNFKKYLYELRNPPEIKKYKKDVEHIQKVDNRFDFRSTLPVLFAKYGFKPVGRGKYSEVFTNPKYPYAIKVFMKDTAYLKYLDWAKKNQSNPFVPKIKGKVIKITNIMMAIRIENLKDHQSGVNARLYNQFMQVLQDPEWFLEGKLDLDKNILKYEKYLKDISEFMMRNRKMSDIHDGNIMSRKDGFPVLVDPLYNYYRNDTFTMDADDITKFENIF